MTSPPISSGKKTTFLGRIAVGLFFAVFLAFGVGFGFGFFFKPVVDVISARGWERASCEILSSKLYTNQSSDGTSYRVDVRYRYVVGGQTHSGTRYKFMSGSSSGYRSKADIVARLRPGTSTECWVDPAHPSVSVINRNPTWELLFALIPLVFLVVGVAGLRFAMFGNWQGGVGIALSGIRTSNVPYVRVASSSQPTTLKQHQTRTAKFVGLTLVALFWNLAISIGLFQIINQWRQGTLGWFFGLFMLPFVGVGLLLIILAVRQGLELTNPRVTLTVNSPVVALGNELTVAWSIAGQLTKLTRFSIDLEGREEATYSQGTTTVTDRNVFAKVAVTSKTAAELAPTGSARVVIPATTMHSFAVAHNKIVWVLRVRGEIPHWPDSDDEFPLTLSPLP